MARISNTRSRANNSTSTSTSNAEGNQHKRWTEQEDKILLDKVKEYPNNLTFAFKQASILLTGRSTHSCANRWYNTVSKYDGKENIALMCVSKNYVGRNRKNCKASVDNTKSTKWSLVWSRIINLFK